MKAPTEKLETVELYMKKDLSGHEVKIVAVGDLMLGDHPVRFGNGVRSVIEKFGAEYLFAQAVSDFKGADIVFGNLESVLSDNGAVRSKLESFEFRGAPSSIDGLVRAGFNVLSFSNNHCLEYGQEAFWETVNGLTERGVSVAGIRGKGGKCTPIYVDKKGLILCILSYSLCRENYYKGADIPYTQACAAQVIAEVTEMKGCADVLIVSLHWGEEYVNYPSPKQVSLAQKLIDSGAHVVLGHHPHVLQGIALYRSGLIAYSLGNFVFDMWQSSTRKTAVMRFSVTRDGVQDVELIPYYINNFFQPERCSGKDEVRRRKEIESLLKDIRNKYSGDLSGDLIEQLEQEYRKVAKRRVLINRLQNYSYFITHLYQYSPNIIRQSLLRAIARRFEEKFSNS